MPKRKTTLPTTKKTPSVPIYEIRGERVVLDHDVAALFGVEVRALNQQVQRNQKKFTDFAFRLTKEEVDNLKSQNVISSGKWGGARKPPLAFTEHGIVMAATVTRSDKAIEATRHVIRTFVRTRREAWERNLTKRPDQLPLALDNPTRQGLSTKLNIALGHVVDAIADPENHKRVEREAKAVASEGLKAIKAILASKQIDNEVRIAQIQETLARAENIQVDTAIKRTTHEEKRLALWVKKLKLIIQAQQFVETGSIDRLMAVLSELESN